MTSVYVTTRMILHSDGQQYRPFITSVSGVHVRSLTRTRVNIQCVCMCACVRAGVGGGEGGERAGKVRRQCNVYHKPQFPKTDCQVRVSRSGGIELVPVCPPAKRLTTRPKAAHAAGLMRSVDASSRSAAQQQPRRRGASALTNCANSAAKCTSSLQAF